MHTCTSTARSIKAHTSKTTRAALAILKACKMKRVLMISGTPALNKPIEVTRVHRAHMGHLVCIWGAAALSFAPFSLASPQPVIANDLCPPHCHRRCSRPCLPWSPAWVSRRTGRGTAQGGDSGSSKVREYGGHVYRRGLVNTCVGCVVWQGW